MTEPQKVCLLTGLPDGYLAQKLLVQLLIKHPELYLLCLVAEPGFDRAHELLSRLSSGDRQRVEILRGDVSSMDFGLTGGRFLELAAQVDIVHHCTCANYGGVSRDAERRHFVGSTGEVLELATAQGAKLSRLIHWSSALLFPPQNGRVTESEATRAARARTREDEMRYRAELLIRDAMNRVPVTILRPTVIVADSKTGELDRQEAPYALIQLIVNSPRELRFPLPGRGDQPCHFVPIDYVIEAGLAIADSPNSIGRTFHITDERPSSVMRVFEMLSESAERPTAPPSFTRNLASLLMNAPGLERLSQMPRNFLELLAQNIVYDARNTRELLAGTGIECPPVDSYLKTMVMRVKREQDPSARPRRPRPSPRSDDLDDPLDV